MNERTLPLETRPTRMSGRTAARARIRDTILLILGLVVSPALTVAQSVDVILKGTIKDQSGDALPGVTVTATNKTTNFVRASTSDGVGYYSLPPIPAGTYDVSAGLAGFSTQVRRDQTFNVGTSITLDFALSLAPTAETIEVTAEAPVLETTKNTLSRLIEKEEIDSLPVVTRNFNDLAALSPGVTRTGVFGGVDIGGSRDFQNSYNVDGISSETHIIGSQRNNYSQDWIQEFQVLTNQFAAEFGQASGGILNAITRSGSNQWSGRVYGFLRNEAWDEEPEFATRKPPLDEFRVGATLGGSILKDRLFFFVGYEWFDNESNNIVTSAFPSANGTFPFLNEEKLFIGKLDYQPGASSAFRFRYNRQDEETEGAGIGGIVTEEFGRFATDTNYDILATWTQIFSASLFNEARAAFVSAENDGGCHFARRNPPGTWFTRQYPNAIFGCPVNFGLIGEDQIQLIDNLSWTAGRHEVKAGIQAFRTTLDFNFRNFRDGAYVFPTNTPFSFANPASYPFFFIIIEGPTEAEISSWAYGLFIQDSWRLSDDFTLNLGLRYDLDNSFSVLNDLVRTDLGLHTINDDTDNISPRLGFAWTPFRNDKRTLIRGGGGLFYDQNHNNLAGVLLANNIQVDRIITINAFSPLSNPFWPDVARARLFLAEALARNTTPDVSGLPGAVGGTNDLDQDLEIPSTLQTTLGVAHEFKGGLSASVDFVYTHGMDQMIIREDNIDRDALLNENRIVRRNPNYTGIGLSTNGGEFDYYAVQVQASYRPNPRHLVKLAYTWAHNESNTVLQFLTGGFVTNPFDLEEDRGPTPNDVRHTLSLNGSTTLPWGFEFSTIAYYRSALPYSAFTNRQLDPDPWADRPEPKNAQRGDEFFSLDARLGKTFNLGGDLSVTAFVEGFNLTDETNFGGFSGNIDTPQFGRPSTASPKRRTQAGLRIDF